MVPCADCTGIVHRDLYVFMYVEVLYDFVEQLISHNWTNSLKHRVNMKKKQHWISVSPNLFSDQLKIP